MKNKGNGYFVFFGPANVGKSTIIGYLLTLEMDERKLQSEVNKIQEKLGDKFQKDRLLSYLVDEAIDEYSKSNEQRSLGTSKYVHIKTYGDFVLIDTPGGAGYTTQRYRGLSLANIGIFAIEIKQLLAFRSNIRPQKEHLLMINDFFSAWFVWKKMHGIDNTIILLTKYDQSSSQEDFNIAKEILSEFIGNDIKNVPIIPTSIDWNNMKDVNITNDSAIQWYKGTCLVDVLREKSSKIPKQAVFSEPLLMFYNKMYPDVRGVGMVTKWKVNSGVLHNKDKINISPININDKWVTISTSIKSLYDGELKVQTDNAYPGNIVDITLSSNNEYKGVNVNIEIPKTAIITNVNEGDIKVGNIINISVNSKELTQEEKAFIEEVPEGREISFLWFGNLLRAIVENKTKTENDFNFKLRTLYDYVALPKPFFPRTLIIQFLATEKQESIMTYKCQIFDIDN